MSAPLTERQRRFAPPSAPTGAKVVEAAIEAGYSETSAKDLGYRTLKLPHVQELILAELARQKGRSGAVGVAALIEIASNTAAPAAARVAAARALVEQAGLIGSAKDAPSTRLAIDFGAPAPDYKAILAAFAGVAAVASAATATVQ